MSDRPVLLDWVVPHREEGLAIAGRKDELAHLKKLEHRWVKMEAAVKGDPEGMELRGDRLLPRWWRKR